MGRPAEGAIGDWQIAKSWEEAYGNSGRLASNSSFSRRGGFGDLRASPAAPSQTGTEKLAVFVCMPYDNPLS